jgi:hypothetical protein
MIDYRLVACAAAVMLPLAGCGYADNVLFHGTPPTAAAPAGATPSPAATAPVAAAPAAAPAAVAAPNETRKPFVVIRFETPDPDYQGALYDALSDALKRRPGLAFDVVAVTRDGDAARRNLANVVHTLAAMGLPADRLTLSAAAAADNGTDEVWIYLR